MNKTYLYAGGSKQLTEGVVGVGTESWVQLKITRNVLLLFKLFLRSFDFLSLFRIPFSHLHLHQGGIWACDQTV